ncbi:MAG: hypothetical protein UR98_C0003G0035 [Parcubacteria group bacterium GW2011_GWA1_36_12]|nr:MAG: hypothetical protein UR98_C0003G0035 [Parcubacteria group bacterium GW2011_GWA1_36_12]
MKPGFLSLIILLVTIIIIALLFVLTNPFKSSSQNEELKTITTPGRINQTQDTVDTYQQKSIERQTIEVQ